MEKSAVGVTADDVKSKIDWVVGFCIGVESDGGSEGTGVLHTVSEVELPFCLMSSDLHLQRGKQPHSFGQVNNTLSVSKRLVTPALRT